MGRTSLQNMLSVLDPMVTWNWDISIPRIPGVPDTRQLTFRAISTTLPETTIETTVWEGHGLRLQSAGRRRFADSWECTFIETRDAGTRDMILTWLEMIRSWGTNTGSYKSEYAVPIELTLYDDKPQPVRGIKLVNAWPTQLGSVSLSQGSEIVQYSVTFAFDLFEDVPVQV